MNALTTLYKSANRQGRKALLAATDRRGNTALHLAAMADSPPCLKFLLDVGANPLAQNAVCCIYSLIVKLFSLILYSMRMGVVQRGIASRKTRETKVEKIQFIQHF